MSLVNTDLIYKIQVVHSGKVLDVSGESRQDGAPVIQWDWHGGPNQKFRVFHLGAEVYFIMAVHSGKVLDVRGVSKDNGAGVIQYRLNGGPNQQFRFLPAADSRGPYYFLSPLHSGKVLD